MSTYLFYKIYFLCLLLLCCTLCMPVCSVSNAQGVFHEVKEVNLFKENEIKDVKTPVCTLPSPQEITVSKIKKYFLVFSGGFMTALLSVNICDCDKKEKCDLLTKYFEANKVENWGKEALNGKLNEWKTQLVSKITEDDKETCKKGRSAVVVNEDEIYFVSVNIIKKNEELTTPNNFNELNLKIATIKIDKSTVPTANIVGETKTLKLTDSNEFAKDFLDKLTKHEEIDCFAFIMADREIGVIIKGKIEGEKEKNIYGILNINDKDTTLKLLLVETAEKCPPLFFSWDGKIIIVSTDCDNKGGKVKRFADMTKWDDGVGPFYHLWHILKDKSDFTEATIGENKKVLLFTEIKNNGKSVGKKEVNLWMSDGNHVKNVGVIVQEIEGDCPIRILSTEKELFFLYQKAKSDDKLENIMLARNEDILKEINFTLDAWHNADKLILTFCTEHSTEKRLCEGKLPTDGVISLLLNEKDGETNWNDKYMFLNGTVENDKEVKTNNGFMFDGNGAGAKLLINKNENELYDFTKYGFTLVAIVTINSGPNSNDKYNSILGMGINDKNKNKISLWCTNDEKWAVSYGEKSTIEKKEEICKPKDVYIVTITFDTKNIVVYIDWEILYKKEQNQIEIKDADEIFHFYFGADITDTVKKSTIESHITVSKVVLYNRPFTADEIDKLKPKKDEKGSPNLQQNKADINEINGNEGSLLNTEIDQREEVEGSNLDEVPIETTTKTTKEAEQLSMRQTENAVGVSVNIVVVMCCIFIFVVFILAGH